MLAGAMPIEHHNNALDIPSKGHHMPAIKKRLSLVALTMVAVVLGLNLGACSSGTTLPRMGKTHSSPVEQLNNPWYQSAQQTLREHQQQTRIQGPTKNIILFVADGHGITSNTALRILDGQRAGKPGEEHILSYEHFPHLALSKTYNTDAQVPDSAGTASAMLTGIKTRRGMIAVDETVKRGDCVTAQQHTVTTALELAEKAGMATGVVTTARLTHATPAASYAHSADRGFEDDSAFTEVQKAAGCRDIAAQLVEFPFGDGIEVAMGGGRQHFLPQAVTDIEGEPGLRTDDRNLVEEWQQRFPDGQYIETQAQFEQLALRAPVLGLFNPSHMAFEVDRHLDKGGEPSLADMTEQAIRVLQQNRRGYFLLVEGGRVDHGHHAGNAHRALEDGRAYAAAIARAAALTSEQDTLIIATADHSHTLTMAGYASRGNPILGLSDTRDAQGNRIPRLANDGLPYTTLGYANGPGATHAKRTDLDNDQVRHKDYRQAALIPLNSETHGGEDVAIYARGPGAWLFDGTVEQHYIFHVMDSVAPW